MRAGRPEGQSLAELIVALTLLSACLGAVGASSVLGARWTAAAERRQEAAWAASAVLDSLLAADSVTAGERRVDDLTAAWTVGAGAGATPVVVTVSGVGRDAVVVLEGAWLAPPPALPRGTPP